MQHGGGGSETAKIRVVIVGRVSDAGQIERVVVVAASTGLSAAGVCDECGVALTVVCIPAGLLSHPRRTHPHHTALPHRSPWWPPFCVSDHQSGARLPQRINSAVGAAG